MKENYSLNNEINIPQIAFGVGRNNYIGNQKLDTDITSDTLFLAIKNGFRLIDASTGYGNLDYVGYAVNKAIAEDIVKREDLVLTQKIGANIGYEGTLEAFETACTSYRTDYIDIMLVYIPLEYTPYWKKYIIDIWRALEKLYKEGKVKAIGVSNFNIEHLSFMLNYVLIKPMINQIEVHPSYQQRLLAHFCKNQEILIEAWSPLLYSVNIPLLKELGVKYNKSSAQIALKWSIQKAYLPIVSSRIEKEIIEDLDIYDFEISNEDMLQIDSLDGGMHSIDNTIQEPLNAREMVNLITNNKNFIKKYRLFGFIPVLTQKKKNNSSTKWYLFGFIPLLKVSTKYTN